MTDYVFDTEADFPIPAVDGNYQLVWDVNLKLAPDHDNYGAVVHAWTQLNGPAVVAGWPAAPGFLFYEQAGKLKITTPNVAPWSSGVRRDVDYKDADVVLHISDTSPGVGPLHHIYWWLWKDNANGVCVRYASRAFAGSHKCEVYKLINGVLTLLATSLDLGQQPDIYLRIKRITGIGVQTFDLYYSLDGTVWTQVFSGSIYDLVHFNENHALMPLYPLYALRILPPYNVEADSYSQCTLVFPPSRWFPESSPILVTDQGQGEWCLNAGVNNGWNLSAFSHVATEPGTSTVLYTYGVGDSPLAAHASWIALPITAAALNAACAAGNLDGERYVFLRVHFTSNTYDRPALTSCTFTGYPANVTCRKPTFVTLSYFAPTHTLYSTWGYPLPRAVSFWLSLEWWDWRTSTWKLVAEGRFAPHPHSAYIDYLPLEIGDQFRLHVSAQCPDCVHSEPVISNEVTIP